MSLCRDLRDFAPELFILAHFVDRSGDLIYAHQLSRIGELLNNWWGKTECLRNETPFNNGA